MKKNRRAFTLIEMLIVLAIIAMLVMIAVPHFMRVKISMNYTNAKAALKSIGSALEAYALDRDRYPGGPVDLVGEGVPYLTKNFFEGEHSGYTFSTDMSDFSYVITATPLSEYTGTKIFMITTGSVISEEDVFS